MLFEAVIEQYDIERVLSNAFNFQPLRHARLTLEPLLALSLPLQTANVRHLPPTSLSTTYRMFCITV
jgi:hypothetical protein